MFNLPDKKLATTQDSQALLSCVRY